MQRPRLTCDQARDLAVAQQTRELTETEQAVLVAHMAETGEHTPDCPKRNPPLDERADE